MPPFWLQLSLVWRLRLAARLGAGGTRVVGVLAYLAACSPAVPLALGAARLTSLPLAAGTDIWARFVLNLLCFVTSLLWALWPVLTAGIDDESEGARFAPLPISPARLMIASSVAGLLEPRAVVVHAPLAGAAAAYLHAHPPAAPWLVPPLALAWLTLSAGGAKLLVHVTLSALHRERSGARIGGFFGVVLVVCAVLPPLDTRWVSALREGGEGLDARVLADAALALSRVPPGLLGGALAQLARGAVQPALGSLLSLVAFAAATWGLAFWALLRFHRRAGRTPPVPPRARDANPFAAEGGRFSALLLREALDLWRAPKARLLASVPLLLAILARLVRAQDLFESALGASADAWLMGGLSLYAATLLGFTFAQNAFGYDGPALGRWLAAPLDVAGVLRAKTLVHGGAGALLAAGVAGFYAVYFDRGGWPELLLSLAAVAGALPLLLVAGNALSLYVPVRFDASLRKRDRLPLYASLAGGLAAAVAVAPWVAVLRACGERRPDAGAVLTLAAVALLSLAVATVLHRVLAAHLRGRAELILRRLLQ